MESLHERPRETGEHVGSWNSEKTHHSRGLRVGRSFSAEQLNSAGRPFEPLAKELRLLGSVGGSGSSTVGTGSFSHCNSEYESTCRAYNAQQNQSRATAAAVVPERPRHSDTTEDGNRQAASSERGTKKLSFRQLKSLHVSLSTVERSVAAAGAKESNEKASELKVIESVTPSSLLQEALMRASRRRADGKMIINLSALTEAIDELGRATEQLDCYTAHLYQAQALGSNRYVRLRAGPEAVAQRTLALDLVSDALSKALGTLSENSNLIRRSRKELHVSEELFERKVSKRSFLRSVVQSLETIRRMQQLLDEVRDALRLHQYDEANRLCKSFDLLYRSSLLRRELGSVVRKGRIFRDFSDVFMDLAARSLQCMFEQVQGLCCKFDAEVFQAVWNAYENLGAELVLAERFAYALEHVLAEIRARALECAQWRQASGATLNESSKREATAASPLLASFTNVWQAAGAHANALAPRTPKSQHVPSNTAPSGGELASRPRNPWEFLDCWAGFLSAICYPVRQLFEHPRISKRFRSIVWEALQARLDADCDFMANQLVAEHDTYPVVKLAELWRSQLVLHALETQWISIAADDHFPEDADGRAAGIYSFDATAPRKHSMVTASPNGSVVRTSSLELNAERLLRGTRQRKQRTLPLATIHENIVKPLLKSYIDLFKRDIESRFMEIFATPNDWQAISVQSLGNTDTRNQMQLDQNRFVPETWRSYWETIRAWYAVPDADPDSCLVVKVLTHELASLRVEDLLSIIWERLHRDEGYSIPDDYTFTGASVFGIECIGTLASMLFAPSEYANVAPAGLFAEAIQQIALFAMYLLGVVYAPCFMATGILGGSLVQLEKYESLRPALSAYQRALLAHFLHEPGSSAASSTALQRPRSELNLSKFCCAVESAWTIGQVAALTLETAATFQEQTQVAYRPESRWRNAFVAEALGRANQLRGLADALQLALYRSLAPALVDTAEITRNVVQQLKQKKAPWWQSITQGQSPVSPSAEGAVHETLGEASAGGNEDAVSVSRASPYVAQITARLRMLHESRGLPAHAEEPLWRACVFGVLVAVQDGIAQIPVTSVDIQCVSQALVDAKTLIGNLEEVLGFHPLPYASELCQFIQLHLAPLPRILQWIATHRETLSRATMRGLVRHGVRLSIDDENASKTFSDEAIERLLTEAAAEVPETAARTSPQVTSEDATDGMQVSVTVLRLDAL